MISESLLSEGDSNPLLILPKRECIRFPSTKVVKIGQTTRLQEI